MTSAVLICPRCESRNVKEYEHKFKDAPHLIPVRECQDCKRFDSLLTEDFNFLVSYGHTKEQAHHLVSIQKKEAEACWKSWECIVIPEIQVWNKLWEGQKINRQNIEPKNPAFDKIGGQS